MEEDFFADRKCKACFMKGVNKPCPCWVDAVEGMTETNLATGDERLVTGCFYQVIPRLMVHVVKASNRPAAAFEELRNKVHEVGRVAVIGAQTTRDMLMGAIGGSPQQTALPKKGDEHEGGDGRS